MSQQNSNFTKSAPPKMSETEYMKKLSSKNPINQIKLFAYNIRQNRLTPVPKSKEANRFKIYSLILGLGFIGWASITRTKVMHLKNDDNATFLADQEIKRILEKEP